MLYFHSVLSSLTVEAGEQQMMKGEKVQLGTEELELLSLKPLLTE